MTVTAKIIPVCLYMIVGIFSMTMAYKNIFSDRFIAFHEQAAGKSWDDIRERNSVCYNRFNESLGPWISSGCFAADGVPPRQLLSK